MRHPALATPPAPRLGGVSTAPAQAPIWRDNRTVDPAWPGPDGSGGSLPPAAVYLALGVALTLVAALVWGLGGFAPRRDVLEDTARGTVVTAGPYELRFTDVTAQQRTDYRGVVSWRLTVTGEGRTTGDVTMAPDTFGDDGMFVAKDPVSGEVQLPQSQTFRSSGLVSGNAFTPGLPLQPYSLAFDFPPDYRPREPLVFVVYRLELRDNSLLGDQEPLWHNAATAYRFRMPVRELPPAVS